MEEYSWLKNIFNNDETKITDKQKSVIKAAIELFSEKGYAASSTREIAQKAGVSEASVFKLFPTKKDLMLWITERIIKTALFPFVLSGIQELLEKSYKNREDFITAFLENRIELIQEGSPLFKILIQELPFQPEIRAMLFEQFKKLPLNLITKKLNLTQTNIEEQQSDFSETDIIKIIISCISGFFIFRVMMFPEIFPESRMKNDAAILARFISRGLINTKEKDYE